MSEQSNKNTLQPKPIPMNIDVHQREMMKQKEFVFPDTSLYGRAADEVYKNLEKATVARVDPYEQRWEGEQVPELAKKRVDQLVQVARNPDYPSHQFEMDADWWDGPGYVQSPKQKLEGKVAAIHMSNVPGDESSSASFGPRENVDYPYEPSRLKRNPSRDWHREFPNFSETNRWRTVYDRSRPNFDGHDRNFEFEGNFEDVNDYPRRS